jgi:transcriptional repressor NrdR
VAYIRFASVYRHFNDLDEFVREIQKMGGHT